MRALLLAAAAGLLGAGDAPAATSLNLGQYALQSFHGMPESARETSAITYNGDRDSFVVVDDEGFDVVEVSRTGQELGRIAVTGHPAQGTLNVQDTESLTYLGANRYMLGSERNRNAFVFTTSFPTPVQTLNLSTDATRIQLFGAADNVGNAGLEGLSYDPLTDSFWGVKEKNLIQIYRFTYDPVTLVPTVTQPFSTAAINALGITDISDVQALGAVPSFAGTDLADNLLILSHESRVLIELDGDGTELSRLDLAPDLLLAWNAEGVTLDFAGNVFIVAEDAAENVPGRMYAYAAVPEPSTLAVLGLAGIAWLGCSLRRARRRA